MGCVFPSCWTVKRTARCYKKTARLVFAPGPPLVFGRGWGDAAPKSSAYGERRGTPACARWVASCFWPQGHQPGLAPSHQAQEQPRTPSTWSNSQCPLGVIFTQLIGSTINKRCAFGAFLILVWPGGKHVHKSFWPLAWVAHAV